MNRGKKIMLLSHCILNCNAKVEGLSSYKSSLIEVVNLLHKEGISIIQLPCPEMSIYGIKRWGHVKNQFDTPFFRSECRGMLTPIVNQVNDYINNGYNVLGVIGIDGSPSCGVNKTCKGSWGGEFKCIENYKKCVETLEMVNEEGVFIEELKKLFKESSLNIPFIALKEENMEDSVKQLNIQIK
ncbi:MAG: hypothetical protein RR645_03640 [Clostridium sp.]